MPDHSGYMILKDGTRVPLIDKKARTDIANHEQRLQNIEQNGAPGGGGGTPGATTSTAISHVREDGTSTTVSAELISLSEENVALTDKVAVSATVSDGVATFKNAKGQNLFTMNIPTGSGNVSGMTEAQVRALIDTYNFALKSELPASWTEVQIRNLITGYGYSTFSGSYNDLTNKPTIPSAVTIDTELSTSSTNPVQNKVIRSVIGNIQSLNTLTKANIVAAINSVLVDVNNKVDASYVENAMNGALGQIQQMLTQYATTEQVNQLIGGIEDGTY